MYNHLRALQERGRFQPRQASRMKSARINNGALYLPVNATELVPFVQGDKVRITRIGDDLELENIGQEVAEDAIQFNANRDGKGGFLWIKSVLSYLFGINWKEVNVRVPFAAVDANRLRIYMSSMEPVEGAPGE